MTPFIKICFSSSGVARRAKAHLYKGARGVSPPRVRFWLYFLFAGTFKTPPPDAWPIFDGTRFSRSAKPLV